jgi:hypothetical protein
VGSTSQGANWRSEVIGQGAVGDALERFEPHRRAGRPCVIGAGRRRRELAVDPQIERGEVAQVALHLQANADCPDLLELERRLLADELALVSSARWDAVRIPSIALSFPLQEIPRYGESPSTPASRPRLRPLWRRTDEVQSPAHGGHPQPVSGGPVLPCSSRGASLDCGGRRGYSTITAAECPSTAPEE